MSLIGFISCDPCSSCFDTSSSSMSGTYGSIVLSSLPFHGFHSLNNTSMLSIVILVTNLYNLYDFKFYLKPMNIHFSLLLSNLPLSSLGTCTYVMHPNTLKRVMLQGIPDHTSCETLFIMQFVGYFFIT